MEQIGLLVGHLMGDYILQNDWMAQYKVAWGRDVRAAWKDVDYVEQDGTRYPRGTTIYHNAMADEHVQSVVLSRQGHIACTIHCLLYTLAVWACSFWWMPWWGLVLCFALHWPVDRFRLAAWWMNNVSGQRVFAYKMGPWSVTVVDNTYHLLCLFLIGLLARGFG